MPAGARASMLDSLFPRKTREEPASVLLRGGRMSSAPSDVRNRFSGAIQRASGLEEKLRQDRLDPQIVSSPVLNRIVGDMRKLARELQLAFEDLSQSIAEQMQAKETATAAQRLAAAV